MGLLRRSPRPGRPRGADGADTEHLTAFARSRRGVEGYLEPATQVTGLTLVLVAGDGEWTRRRVSSLKAAFALGAQLAVPVYDVAATGYPARMRAWTAQRSAAGELGSTRPD